MFHDKTINAITYLYLIKEYKTNLYTAISNVVN